MNFDALINIVPSLRSVMATPIFSSMPPRFEYLEIHRHIRKLDRITRKHCSAHMFERSILRPTDRNNPVQLRSALNLDFSRLDASIALCGSITIKSGVSGVCFNAGEWDTDRSFLLKLNAGQCNAALRHIFTGTIRIRNITCTPIP